ncbi:MAG: alpha/beta hydrolase [Patescibacteria group bacterium]
MIKRVFIVHGYDATPADNWFPWLKKELEVKGFEVEVPAMPEADQPTLHKWLTQLQQSVGRCDENTFLVGHSLGTITILKFLEALPEGQKSGGAVLVGGFSESLDFSPLSSFTEKPLNYEKVKKSVTPAKNGASKIIAIHSTDDTSVPYRYAEIIRDKLGAKLITLQGLGHLNWRSNCLELPQALGAILKMNG